MKFGLFFAAHTRYAKSMDFSLLHLDPVAFAIGPLVIRWYALAYLAGFLLGWRYCLRLVRGNESRPGAEDIDDFLTWAVIAVILGGRLGYVLFYQPAHYLANPLEIAQVWKGGMSFHGGVLGVFAAMVIFAKKRGFCVFKLADIICAAAPIGLFFGRIANFINGELYGTVTGTTNGIVFPGGGISPRHPSQIYEAVLEGLVLFFILRWLIRSPNIRPGIVSGMFLIGYGLFRMLVEFVREPDEYLGLVGGFISMGQILCVPMIAIGAAVVYIAQRRTP